MTYKETLFFIGKSLTINHEEHNKIIVENELKSDNIDWDAVVKVSTAHFVFPALYCNLKKANFLHYLPEELVNYMQHITDLNRERNQQIIDQAKEINELLLANNITPIFLKGTGNLLEDLYDDIAERMVGDIDLLVSDKSFEKTISILNENGYEKNSKKADNTFLERHYPKIVKENKIASVEIHHRMVSNSFFNKSFNYTMVKTDVLKIENNFSLLSYKNQIILTSINKQINDFQEKLKSFTLRASYDLFLLSKKESTLNTLINFKTGFKTLNNFVFSSSYLLGSPKSLSFKNNSDVRKFLNNQLYFLDKPRSKKRNDLLWKSYFLIRLRLITIYKSIYLKQGRNYIIDRIFNKPNP